MSYTNCVYCGVPTGGTKICKSQECFNARKAKARAETMIDYECPFCKQTIQVKQYFSKERGSCGSVECRKALIQQRREHIPAENRMLQAIFPTHQGLIRNSKSLVKPCLRCGKKFNGSTVNRICGTCAQINEKFRGQI